MNTVTIAGLQIPISVLESSGEESSGEDVAIQARVEELGLMETRAIRLTRDLDAYRQRMIEGQS